MRAKLKPETVTKPLISFNAGATLACWSIPKRRYSVRYMVSPPVGRVEKIGPDFRVHAFSVVPCILLPLCHNQALSRLRPLRMTGRVLGYFAVAGLGAFTTDKGS
jgi:hypothetical protein